MHLLAAKSSKISLDEKHHLILTRNNSGGF